ncbi:putative SP-containing membrane protein [Vairimorpha necatrix]|uniref:SP-containing membrane protein n=1 Tax=Vairimorpha necatrix TaxID=6039 RepID=A0AAX4JDW7_9MICR
MFFLFAFVFSDNIEISTSSFDLLIVKSFYIRSSSLDCNSIKISYPGTSLYEIKQKVFYIPNNIKPVRILYLKNSTEYFKKLGTVIRIDFERKICGMIVDAWIMVFVMVSVSMYFIVFCEKPFGIFEV